MAHQIAKDHEREIEYFQEATPRKAGGLRLFRNLMAQRIGGIVNTDSGPFIDRNIPAIGFSVDRSANTGGSAIIHEPRDTIDQTSAETLDWSGKYIEQYIRTVEKIGDDVSPKSRYYIVESARYMTTPVYIWMWLHILWMGGIWFGYWKTYDVTWRGFLEYIRGEKAWIGVGLGISILLVGFYYKFSAEISLGYGIFNPMGGIWGGATISAGIGSAIWRKKVLTESRKCKNAYPHVLLNTVYILLLLYMAFVLHPLIAIYFMVLPILFLGKMENRHIFSKIATAVVFLLWTVVQMILVWNHVRTYLFEPLSADLLHLLFANIGVWIFTCIYGFAESPQKNF